MLVGTIHALTGACPVCGQSVPLAHCQSPLGLTDAYSCPSCGPTTYRVRASHPGA